MWRRASKAASRSPIPTMPRPTGCSATSSSDRRFHAMSLAPRLIGVPAAEIAAVWPLVEPLIADACRRGGGKDAPPDIRRALTERDQQLWLAWDGSVVALAVTEIVCHPRKKCCRIR